MRRRLLWILLCLSSAAAASPFDKGGINGVGARAEAMGGAVVAQPGDSSSLWWNPAALELHDQFSLYYQYGSILDGNTLDEVIAQSADIPALGLTYGVGYRRELDSVSSGYTEQTTLLSANFPFTDDGRLNFGSSVKLYNTSLNDVSDAEANGYGIDFGFLYRPPLPGDGLRVGVALMDFQASLSSIGGADESPPQLLQAGASYRIDKDTIAEVDTELVTNRIDPNGSNSGFRLGAERWFGFPKFGLDQLIALRIGYLQSSSLEPTSLGGLFTMGGALQWAGLDLEYAYMQDVSELGESQRISINYSFMPEKLEASSTPSPSPSPLALSPTVLSIPTATLTPTPVFGLGASFHTFAPLTGSLRPNVSFGIYADGIGPLQSYSLVLSRSGSALPLRSYRGTVLPPEILWDGRDNQRHRVKDGAYTATLRVQLSNGQLLKTSSDVVVDTRHPDIVLEAPSRIFEPGDATKGIQFHVNSQFYPGLSERWDLLLEAVSGKRVKLMGGEGSAPHSLTWDGLDDAGTSVPNESLYYATLREYMPSGAVVRTARLAIGSEVTAFEGQSAIKLTLATIHLEPSEENPNLDDYKSLKEAADAVKKYGTDYMVQVLGYADPQEPLGPFSALELSFLRAKEVKDYLCSSGGLDPTRVKAMGYGSERPLSSDGSADGQARNRRVDVILYTK